MSRSAILHRSAPFHSRRQGATSLFFFFFSFGVVAGRGTDRPTDNLQLSSRPLPSSPRDTPSIDDPFFFRARARTEAEEGASRRPARAPAGGSKPWCAAGRRAPPIARAAVRNAIVSSTKPTLRFDLGCPRVTCDPRTRQCRRF